MMYYHPLYKYIGLFLILLVCNGCQSGSIGEPASPTSQPLVAVEQVTPTSAPSASRAPHCSPTHDDQVSPSYIPNTPERTVVGHGHVLTGQVLSSQDCLPIVHARLEFWPEIASQGHPDAQRATFYSNENGQYRFECELPEHIHMKVSAPGYRTIGINSYHPGGRAAGTFDIVLEPNRNP